MLEGFLHATGFFLTQKRKNLKCFSGESIFFFLTFFLFTAEFM